MFNHSPIDVQLLRFRLFTSTNKTAIKYLCTHLFIIAFFHRFTSRNSCYPILFCILWWQVRLPYFHLLVGTLHRKMNLFYFPHVSVPVSKPHQWAVEKNSEERQENPSTGWRMAGRVGFMPVDVHEASSRLDGGQKGGWLNRHILPPFQHPHPCCLQKQQVEVGREREANSEPETSSKPGWDREKSVPQEERNQPRRHYNSWALKNWCS